MTQEELDRIAELEEVKEFGGELDEEERDELRALKSARSAENRQLRHSKERAKKMAEFAKAKKVWCLPLSEHESPLYVLTHEEMKKLCTPRYIMLDGKEHKVGPFDNDDLLLASEVDRPAIEHIDYHPDDRVFYDTRFE